jgi:hypothetical protein
MVGIDGEDRKIDDVDICDVDRKPTAVAEEASRVV